MPEEETQFDDFALDDFFPQVSDGVRERIPRKNVTVYIPIEDPDSFFKLTGISKDFLHIRERTNEDDKYNPINNNFLNSNNINNTNDIPDCKYNKQNDSSLSNNFIYELPFQILTPEQHSLWAHCIWNAGKSLAKAILNQKINVKGKRIIELGAGAALPSMAAILMGAELVVATDYPEESLLEPLKINLQVNMEKYNKPESSGHWKVSGYTWGTDLNALKQFNHGKNFDIVIQSDVICNHSQHQNLLNTVKLASDIDSKSHSTEALVYFSHHRIWLVKEDLEYFTLAQKNGFQVEKMYEELYPVMFEEDSKFDKSEDDKKLREIVHAYRIVFIPQ